jgi:hypothetical protein
MIGNINLGGGLTVRKIKRKQAPIGWRIQNSIRPAYWGGWLAVRVAIAFSWLTGIPTLTSQLSIILRRSDGSVIDYGVVGYRSITTAFVNYMVDQLQTETSTWGDFKYHDSGVGTTAENVSNTDMETTDGESRATGTQTETSANIYRSVGTIAYTSTKAITEHGLFNASSGVTLLDRTVFSAVNVVSGDSCEFTYSLTVSSGG